MTTTVGSAPELELRKQVERAVRPLRAAEANKLRIRQELLAHLTDIFHEELAKAQTEAAALAAAFQRFGDPVEITRELERSMGFSQHAAWWAERYENMLDRVYSRREHESFLRFAARGVFTITMLTLGLIGVICGLIWTATGGPDDPTTYGLLARLIPLIIVTEITALFAAAAVDQLTARRQGLRRWRVLLAQVIAWSSLLVGCSVIFWWSLTGKLLSAGELVRMAIMIVATIGCLLCVAAFACDYSRRRKQMLDAWRQLEID